jgi:hypothetical protein
VHETHEMTERRSMKLLRCTEDVKTNFSRPNNEERRGNDLGINIYDALLQSVCDE